MFGSKRVVAVLAATSVGVLAATALAAPAGAKPTASRTTSHLAAVLIRPHAATNQLDPYGPQGMNVDAAQSDFTEGDPRVIVAYIEGGINWYDQGTQAQNLADSVYVNWHETPVPCSG